MQVFSGMRALWTIVGSCLRGGEAIFKGDARCWKKNAPEGWIRGVGAGLFSNGLDTGNEDVGENQAWGAPRRVDPRVVWSSWVSQPRT